MAVVKVPKTPKSSYDKDRRPSGLLIEQIRHLEWAALPASQRKPSHLKKYKKVQTEGQAAERIAQLTAMVLAAKEAAAAAPPAPGVQPYVKLPPVQQVKRSRKPKKKMKRSQQARKPKSRARAKAKGARSAGARKRR